jgi:hypothetical protein
VRVLGGAGRHVALHATSAERRSVGDQICRDVTISRQFWVIGTAVPTCAIRGTLRQTERRPIEPRLAHPAPPPRRGLAARCGSAAQNSSPARVSPPDSAGILGCHALEQLARAPQAGLAAPGFGLAAAPAPGAAGKLARSRGRAAWERRHAALRRAVLGAWRAHRGPRRPHRRANPGGDPRARLAALRRAAPAGPSGAVRKRAPGARSPAAPERCGSAAGSPAGAARKPRSIPQSTASWRSSAPALRGPERRRGGAPRRGKRASRRGGSTPGRLDRVFQGPAPIPLVRSRALKEPSRPRCFRPGRLGEVGRGPPRPARP